MPNNKFIYGKDSFELEDGEDNKDQDQKQDQESKKSDPPSKGVSHRPEGGISR